MSARWLALAAIVGTLTCDGGSGTDPVIEPNRAPQPVGSIAPRQLFSGDSVVVDAAAHFHDQDGDPLTHSATSSHPQTVAVTVSGSIVTLRAVSQGTANITVTATDPEGLSAVLDFEAMVPNRGPVAVGAIADLELEAGTTATIRLDDYFSDPDGDSLSFTAMSSDTAVATVAVAGDSLRIAALAKGPATVTVAARDAGGQEALHRFAAMVPNRAPVVTDLLPRRRLEVGDTLRVGLPGYFSDPDGDSVSFTAASSDTAAVRAIAAGEILAIVAQLSDSATITVAATDTEGLTAVQVFTVVVANRAPEAIGTIPDFTLTEGDTAVLDLSRHFRDPDADSLSYTVRSSRRIRVTAAVAGDSLTLSAETAGSSTITLTARDPDSLSVTQRFRVVVERPRYPDLVVESPAVDADSIAPGATFILSAVVRNRGDGDAMSPTTLHFFRSYDTRITTTDSPVGTHPVPRLVVDATGAGSVSATGPADPGIYFYGACALPLDSESDIGNNCSGSVRLRVWQPNRAPRAVGAIRSRPVGAGASISLGVARYFDDPDADTLTYSAASSAPLIATASAKDGIVTVSGVAAGQAMIMVTARDPDGLTAIRSFEVTVQPAPSPDLVVQFSASAASLGPGDPFTLNATVRNQGSGASSATTLRYYRSSDALIGTADALLGTDPVGRLDPALSSSQSLSATAPTDGEIHYFGACIDALANESDRANNCSDAFAVQIVLVNRTPRGIGTISNRALIVGGSVAVDVGGHFVDPDGDVLNYSAVSSDTLTARAAALNSSVAVAGVGVGGATIVVTATDPGGLAATRSFDVSVEDETALLPDLVVSALSVDVTDSIEAGARFTLGGDVHNRGPGDASATTLRYYHSADGAITTSDTELASEGVAQLVSNEASAHATALSAPSDAGTHYFGACVDAVGNEPDVANNCSGAVELLVWRRNRPPRPVSEIADGSVTVGNTISLDVASNFTDPDGDDLRYSVSSSAPNRARATNLGSSVTVTGVAQGDATITVTARDPGDLAAIQTFDVDVTVAAQPDLVVSAIRANVDSIAPSTTFTLTAVVRNQGTVSLPTSTTVRFHRSDDPIIGSNDTEIGSRGIGQLAASQSAGRFVTQTGPTTEGRYYYGACVDGVAGESNRGNNCSGAVDVWVGHFNRAPRARGTIGPMTLDLDDEESLNPAAYFTDPDQDSLTYSADSSNPDAVSVEVNNNTVEFKGQALGRSTITVTARDPDGLTATQSFRVTVAELPNRAPRLISGIEDIDGANIGNGYSAPLLAIFNDPDGDPLDYTTANTSSAVASVATRNDSIFVRALSVGSTTISVTATDPGGLSANDSFDMTVLAASFDIRLGFTSSVTEATREVVRAAAGGWESILRPTELSDITFDREIACAGLTATVGTVDDHMVFVHVTDIDGSGGILASATYCYRRISDGTPIVSAMGFDEADIQTLLGAGTLADVAVHEIAHGLGFLDSSWEDAGLLDDGTDPHFTGGLARAAFDAAGGTSYAGSKVPISSPDLSHWRESVFGAELMSPLLEIGATLPLSAITIQAMADLGYSVDVGLADSYGLPGPRPPGPVVYEPGRVLDLGGDVVRGPVLIVGPDGRPIRVVQPPGGSAQSTRGPAREVRIEIRRPQDPSDSGSLRQPTARGTFWRRDSSPASRPGSP